jgi:hypothetical protein
MQTTMNFNVAGDLSSSDDSDIEVLSTIGKEGKRIGSD